MFGGGTFLLVQEGWGFGAVKGCGDDEDFLLKWHADSVYRHDCNFLLRVGGTDVPIPACLFDFRVVFCHVRLGRVRCRSNDYHLGVHVHRLSPNDSNVRVLSIIGYSIRGIKRKGLFRLFDDLGEN